MPVVTKEPEGTSTPYKGVTFSYDGGPLLSNQAIKDRKEWLKTNQWDTISIGRHIPSNVKYMVVDVETHDWDIFDRNNRSKSRIVELAWLAYNASGVIVDSKQYLIKPHGYKEISSKAVEVHGITTKCAIEYGNYASDVFTEFVSILRALLRDGIVVAYNMINEHQIFNYNLSSEQCRVWNNIPKCDVYNIALWKYLPPEADDMYKKKCKSRKYGMKLQMLHNIICPEKEICSVPSHFAGGDVKMTWDIFCYYKQYATNYELKWKHRNLVPSTKYSGISVVTNVGPLIGLY